MKAYAGVNIRKTEELVQNIRAYEENLLYAMADLMTHYPHIPFERKETGKRILIAFGSSQGLCGPFNEKMVEAVSGLINSNDTLFIIGGRLRSAIESRQIPYAGYIDSPVSVNGLKESLKEALLQIIKIYSQKEYYNLRVVFTIILENKAMTSIEQILPPDLKRVRAIKPARSSPMTYSEPAMVFEKVLEEFLHIGLYRCYMESLRSENWYRLRSMEGASDNLTRRLSDLCSLQNYVRQEEITEEMLEILGAGRFYSSSIP